jgi:hypothetical protein
VKNTHLRTNKKGGYVIHDVEWNCKMAINGSKRGSCCDWLSFLLSIGWLVCVIVLDYVVLSYEGFTISGSCCFSGNHILFCLILFRNGPKMDNVSQQYLFNNIRCVLWRLILIGIISIWCEKYTFEDKQERRIFIEFWRSVSYCCDWLLHIVNIFLFDFLFSIYRIVVILNFL